MLFGEGKLTGAPQDAVADHVKSCSECVFVLGETSRFLQEQETAAAEEEPPPSGSASTWWLAAAAAVVIIASAATWRGVRSHDPVRRMTAAAESVAIRPVEARLAGFPYGRFEAPRSAAGGDDALASVRIVARSVAEDPDLALNTAGLHARGVAQLLSGQNDRAIEFLLRAVTVAPQEPRYWSDLAAARIAAASVRAEETQLRAAVADAERALALDARSPTAFFNRAVAREHLGLRVKAVEDYRHAAMLEPNTPWSREANFRVAELTR